jgi:hypothetical protein
MESALKELCAHAAQSKIGLGKAARDQDVLPIFWANFQKSIDPEKLSQQAPFGLSFAKKDEGYAYTLIGSIVIPVLGGKEGFPDFFAECETSALMHQVLQRGFAESKEWVLVVEDPCSKIAFVIGEKGEIKEVIRDPRVAMVGGVQIVVA